MILLPLAKFPSDLLHLPWKGVFLPPHSDVWQGFLRASRPGSSTFLFWNENMTSSWRILMRVVILILPVVLGWVSGVSTPSRDACRGYSVGRAKFNSYRCMYVRRFFVFLSLTFGLMFWYNRVTGCVGSSVRRSDTITGCLRGTLRLSGTKLILDIIWTCATHVHSLYRVWAFFIGSLVLQRTVEWMALQSFRVDIIQFER